MGFKNNNGNTLKSTSRNVLAICVYCDKYYNSYNNCETYCTIIKYSNFYTYEVLYSLCVTSFASRPTYSRLFWLMKCIDQNKVI